MLLQCPHAFSYLKSDAKTELRLKEETKWGQGVGSYVNVVQNHPPICQNFSLRAMSLLPFFSPFPHKYITTNICVTGLAIKFL
ncbi:hypothetical protein EUGRSUZ_K02722 [Eucalyptus grandis]|uniref:Uncharacterized protein n=2 Tax=Eucalyptus grandis TaxID=71139 RepID=A0ACC3IYN6_EUCGR|nr:hypothetical protein EUGRSUZ_K02722 [Eucalyptus grandis]